jgi:hypothetical protein
MSKKPETIFKEKLLKKLKEVPNIWVLKTHEIARRGVPDLIICFEGGFYAFELKKDSKESPDPLQTYELNTISQKAKGVTGTLHPENYKKVLTKLGILKGE